MKTYVRKSLDPFTASVQMFKHIQYGDEQGGIQFHFTLHNNFGWPRLYI